MVRSEKSWPSQPLYQQWLALPAPSQSAVLISQRGVDRQRVFFTNADRRTYLDMLGCYAAQAQLGILSYCLMDNQVHLWRCPKSPPRSVWLCAALTGATLFT